MSMKRMRDDEYLRYLDEPPLKQQSSSEMLASPHSPTHTSSSNVGAMCLTPMAGFGADEATQALEMGVRWAVHQRQGPRR